MVNDPVHWEIRQPVECWVPGCTLRTRHFSDTCVIHRTEGPAPLHDGQERDVYMPAWELWWAGLDGGVAVLVDEGSRVEDAPAAQLVVPDSLLGIAADDDEDG